jgi:hypothetical protein
MNNREYDIVYGLHSNIPVCCIIFFLTEWHLENKRNSPYARAVHMALYNYVPCPECLAWHRKNMLRLCDEECGKKCYEDFSNRSVTSEERQQILAVEMEMD